MRRALATLLAACCLQTAPAQVPIPTRPDGFVYKSAGGAVVLEAFFDLMCPDCKAAWPTVKQVADHYGPEKLEFRFHTFPLPYHRNAYWASQGAHVIAAQNASAVYPWLEAVFAEQESFGNQATSGLTSPQIIAKFGDLAERATGVQAESVVAGLGDINFDWATRVSWKYGCSRYVSGTPTFLINGVQVAAEASWTAAEWQQVLDPFFASTAVSAPALSLANTTCPAGEPVCEYLPGKVECCYSGEACIPNVGCRCRNAADTLCAQRRSASAVVAERAVAAPAVANTTCPAGEPVCEYLPGKVECCYSGEACIPNVGCRCRNAADTLCAQRRSASAVVAEPTVAAPAVANTTCPAGEPVCKYLPGKVECCYSGEACIPNVGCRCRNAADALCAQRRGAIFA